MVRITFNMLSDRTIFNLHNNMQRIAQLQDQLSTGKRINKPSDDPVDFPSSLQLRATVQQTHSYQRNVASALANLEHTESTLGSTTTLLQDIRTLAVQGASDFDTPARLALAEQVGVLHGQLLELSNANVKGQYLFGGSKSTAQSFIAKDGTVLYQGDDQDRLAAVGRGTTVSANLTGLQTFLHTPSEITGALSLEDTTRPLAEQLRAAHPDFPNLPPIPDGPKGAQVDRSPNPSNHPGAAPNNLARFYIHGQEVRVDLSVDSLQDVVNRINATVKDAVASINERNQLVITSRRGDALDIRDGERPIGFEPDPPYGLNLLGALGLYRRVEEGRSLAMGYPAASPLTNPDADPTPTRTPVRVQGDSFLFARTNTGPATEPAIPFGDNLAITDVNAGGEEVFLNANTPAFLDELEAIRITIDGEVIDLDLRALTRGRDFNGVLGDQDDIPGSTVDDLLEYINNHPSLNGRATAYINADRNGIGITATANVQDFRVDNARILFGRDITTRVTVDPLSGDTRITQADRITGSTKLDDLPGALVDPIEGSLGVRRPDPPPAGMPPTTNEGFIVIQNNSKSEAIDLRYAETVDDVLAAINQSKVGVEARINQWGTGIEIVSVVPSDEPLSVLDMHEGTIARDLGLFSPPAPTRLQSNPGFAGGDQVGAIAPAAVEGSFEIEIRDGAGAVLERYTIEVDPADTLADIAQRIDRADGKAGPGGGLISANMIGGQLNIVSHYDGHTIRIDPAKDTTGVNAAQRFTEVIGLAGYTAVLEADVDPPTRYESRQNTASALGVQGAGEAQVVDERNLFRSVRNLERALRNDDTKGIQQALEDLDLDLDKILTSRTNLGARVNRLESAQSRLKLNEDFMREEVSRIEDVDLAQAISDYTMAQNAFNAALQVSSRILQQSLLDFLR